MESTLEQQEQIRLLSDSVLYHEAITLARQYQQGKAIANSQLSGLLEYSRSWRDITSFVDHQLKRDWGEPGKSKKAHYRDFYAALAEWFKKLQHEVKENYGFVSSGLSKRETREQMAFFAGLLAREFIQHLVAEMMYQNRKQEAKS